MTSMTTSGAAARDGARTAIPLGLAALPFGLVYGVAVADSSINGLLGVAASWIVLAGAAQLTLLGLIDDGAAWPIAVGTALLINARFALYSTALATPFRDFPSRWRYSLPYLLTDQAASLSLLQFDRDGDPERRRWWFLGAALLFASGWWIGTVVGYFAGGLIPEQVEIGFAVPAMFIALLVPTLVDRPALVAAAVAGIITVATSALPNGLNVMAAALGGIGAARVLTQPRVTT
jgi:predicted branched-subunit amino acid permease